MLDPRLVALVIRRRKMEIHISFKVRPGTNVVKFIRTGPSLRSGWAYRPVVVRLRLQLDIHPMFLLGDSFAIVNALVAGYAVSRPQRTPYANIITGIRSVFWIAPLQHRSQRVAV